MKSLLLTLFALSAITFGAKEPTYETVSREAAPELEMPVMPVLNCSYNGIDLHGKVQIVDAFPDIKVQFVDAFPDIKVQWVTAFPDDCGEWQEVDAFPDFKIQIVDAFPDIKVQEVDAFPGMN